MNHLFSGKTSMLSKKLIVLGLLLISLLCISSVSAAEDFANDTLSADNDNKIILDESINEDVLNNKNENEELILSTDNQNSKSLETDIEDETLSDAVGTFTDHGNEKYIGADETGRINVADGSIKKGTFTDLENQINNAGGHSLDLSYDFEYDPVYDAGKFPDGISFSKHSDDGTFYFTINGNGHSICGNELSRIFVIWDYAPLELKDLTLCHGFAEDGSAVLVTQNSVLKACNVTFIHNNATFNGGAIAGIGDVRVLDCIFINNLPSLEEGQSTNPIQ